MRKIQCIVIAICLLLSLSGCVRDDNGVSGAESVSSAAESGTGSESPDNRYSDITVNGASLSKFTIVYRETTDCAKYYDVAAELNDFISSVCGYTLKVTGDSTAETEYEILIGFTAGRELRNAFDRDSFEAGQYTLVVLGSKIMLAANYANGSHFAYLALSRAIRSDTDGDLTDFTYNGKEEVTKIACVGDSITEAYNSDDRYTQSYPAYLQGLLGWNYCVLNAGIGGFSVCNTDVYAYADSAEFRAAKAFNPDIVIFELGTNDCNPVHDYKDWSDPERETVFKASAKEIIDAFYDLNPDVTVLICLPTSVFPVEGYSAETANDWAAQIETYALPLLNDIAAEYGIGTIDLHSWSLTHPEVFKDGLHPYNESYLTYAEEVYRNLLPVLTANNG